MKRILLLVLFLLWLFSTYFYIQRSELGFLSLGDGLPVEKLAGHKSGMLLRDDEVRGNFHSQYNNLGIVAIRFGSIDQINNDAYFQFRIREVGHEWINETRYEIGQLRQNSFFRFSFPIIIDSAGRDYQFEIKYASSSSEKMIFLDPTSPTVIVEYPFAKGQLLSYKTFFYFFPRKLLNLIGDQAFLTFLFASSLPFGAYLVFLLFGGSYTVSAFLVLLIIVFDIFLVHGIYDNIFLSVIFAWLLPVVKYKIESRVSLSLAMVFLWTTLLFLLSDVATWSDKAMIWLYLFLVVFSVQLVFELRWPVKEKVLVRDFWVSMVNSVYNSFRVVFYLVRGDYKVVAKILGVHTRINPVYLQRTGWVLRHLLLLIMYLTPLWLVWLTGRRVVGLVNFYNDFFPSSQWALFFWRTGIYLVLLVLVSIVFFIFFSRRYRYVKQIVLAILILLLTYQISEIISVQTTRFRYDIVAWKVRGNETAEPWVDVFVAGRNFRDRPFVGKVLVNGVEQRIIEWTDREVVFRTDPLVTTSGELEVVTDDGMRSNKLDFKYYGDR